MQKKTNKGDANITVVKDHNGSTVKYGKVQPMGKPMTTYEKAYSQMSNGTPKEGGVKRQAKAVTKSNAKGTHGKANSRKRN